MNIKINKNYIILFLLGVIILFVRSGYNFITPIIYAEDGTWMSDIINNGFLYTLLNAKGGIFCFWKYYFIRIFQIPKFYFLWLQFNLFANIYFAGTIYIYDIMFTDCS